MQCNPQYFVTGPPNCSQFYPCSQPYQPPCNVPCPDIIGEGEITSIVLPDGSVQLYFLPTSKWSPYVQNANLINCSPYWNPNTGAWFIRSVSNQPPCPTPLFHQQCVYPRPNSHNALPPCHSIPVKFHNDNWSSTTDLHYFAPCLRTCELPPPPPPCAAVQATAPTVSCCYGTVCDNPCYCGPNCKGAPSIFKGHVFYNAKDNDNNCICTKEHAKISRCDSDMSIDETRHKSPKKEKDLVICDCYSSTSDKSPDRKKRDKKRKEKRSRSNSTVSSSSSICKSKSEIKKAKKCQEKAHRKAEEKERKRQEKEAKKIKKEISKLKKESVKKHHEAQSSTTESDYNSCNCLSNFSFEFMPTSTSTSRSSCDCDRSYKQKTKLDTKLDDSPNENKKAKKRQEKEQQLQEKREKKKQEKAQKLQEREAKKRQIAEEKKKEKERKMAAKDKKSQEKAECHEKKLEIKKDKQDRETTDKRSRESNSSCECPDTPDDYNLPETECNLEGSPVRSSHDRKNYVRSCCGGTRDMFCECAAPPTANKLLATQNDRCCSGICLNSRGLDFGCDFPTTTCWRENNSEELCAQTLSNEPLTVVKS